MPERIIIEGGLARIENIEPLREVALKDLMPLIETRVPIAPPKLPDRTVFFRYDPTNIDNLKVEVLIEVQPHTRTISVDHRDHKLSFPWTYFFFNYASTNRGASWHTTNYKCFNAKEQVEGDDSILLPPFLPNVDPNGLICFGNTARAYPRTLAGQVNGTVNDFWLSNFNHFNRRGGIPGNRTTYTQWEKMTRDNPGGWKDWEDWGTPGNPFTNNPHHTVGSLWTIPDVDRTAIHFTDQSIPELRIATTFGMAEQWIADRTPQQRFRIRRALLNFEAEHGADAFQQPEPDTIDDEEAE